MTIPLGPPLLTGSSCQPGSAGAQAALRGCPRARSLFGIAPGGACRAGPVARPAVGFYPTVSPLPAAGTPKGPGRRRSLLCGAFPGVAPAGRYPAPCLHGARTFLARPRPEGRPARGHPAIRRRRDRGGGGPGQARPHRPGGRKIHQHGRRGRAAPCPVSRAAAPRGSAPDARPAAAAGRGSRGGCRRGSRGLPWYPAARSGGAGCGPARR